VPLNEFVFPVDRIENVQTQVRAILFLKKRRINRRFVVGESATTSVVQQLWATGLTYSRMRRIN